jgi:replicative DNA helicase
MEERITGRSLPHNEDAERALIGALILDSERIPEVAEILQPEDFFDRRHQILYQTLASLAEGNVPVDFISVGEALKAAGRFHEVGGVEYLAELGRAVTSSAFAGHHAQIIAETSTLRQLIREGTEIVTKAYETRPSGEAVRELLDDCEQRIYRIARQEETSGPAAISGAIHEAFDPYRRRWLSPWERLALRDIDTALKSLTAAE